MRTKKDIVKRPPAASQTCVFGTAHARQFDGLAGVAGDSGVSMTPVEIGARYKPLPNGS